MDNIKIEKIKELAAKRFLLIEIAKEVGLSRETVKAWAKTCNISIFSKQERLGERKQELVCLYKQGNTINELRELGYSYDFIKSSVIEAGLEWRDSAVRGKERRLSNEEVLARLPNSNGCVVLGFENGYYLIQDTRGKIFKKKAVKLYQGIPYHCKTAQDFAEKLLLKTGKSLIMESFNGTKSPCKALCKNGHTLEYALAEGALAHVDCKICNNIGISKEEKEILQWIKDLKMDASKFFFEKEIIDGKKQSGKPKEIDIFIPSIRLGIEYCGLYYHSDEFIKKKFFHFDKMLMANKENIQLITLFEDEWKFRNSQVKGFLMAKMNLNVRKINGRDCEVKKIDKFESKAFLDANHIQGASRGEKLCVGLFYENEMVGVITGTQHHRNNDRATLILSRLCFKNGVTVMGGSSKMFSLFVQLAKELYYKKIISWSDNRWSEGKVYKALGFAMTSDLKPDYSYVKNSRRYSKQSLKKTKKEKMSDQTEKALRLEQGYHRIWDCGKKRWTLSL